MLMVLAAVAVLSTTAVPEVQTCEHSYGDKAAARGLRAALKHHTPMTQAMGARAWRYVNCARNPNRARRLHTELKRWRRSYQHVWPIRLNGQSATWIQWARNITACESGWNRYASNGSHFSYFQWASSTWAAASSGFDAPASPYNASWPHQAVIAIHWAKTVGTSQWVCKG